MPKTQPCCRGKRDHEPQTVAKAQFTMTVYAIAHLPFTDRDSYKRYQARPTAAAIYSLMQRMLQVSIPNEILAAEISGLDVCYTGAGGPFR
jgi:hypothetical protein